jgi:hypothetical protein
MMWRKWETNALSLSAPLTLQSGSISELPFLVHTSQQIKMVKTGLDAMRGD